MFFLIVFVHSGWVVVGTCVCVCVYCVCVVVCVSINVCAGCDQVVCVFVMHVCVY